MFTGNFEADYLAVQKALEQRRPIALSRFGDGEWSILNGKPYNAASGWRFRGESWLRGALLESLVESGDGYHVGHSPPCCHPKCVGYYSAQVAVPSERRTYMTVFSHGNFTRAKGFLGRLDAVIVGPGPKCQIQIPTDTINNMFDVDAVVQQLLQVEKPILVAGGPAACLIVHRYWRWSKLAKIQMPIIDIGATLDETLHGRQTRYYHDPKSGLQRHFCRWDNWDNAKQRQVVGVHSATHGNFVRDVRAPNPMQSPTQQVVARRQGSPEPPKWTTHRPGARKKR